MLDYRAQEIGVKGGFFMTQNEDIEMLDEPQRW
jgi:hypothetical protein